MHFIRVLPFERFGVKSVTSRATYQKTRPNILNRCSKANKNGYFPLTKEFVISNFKILFFICNWN